MAKTNFAGPITTGRFQHNGKDQVRTSQFLMNGAQFHIDYTYFQVTTDDNRLATLANNPIGTTTYTLETVAGTNVSGLTYGGGIPAMKATITSGSDERALTFSVIGTDVNGFRQTEDITGPNATTISTAKMYKTVTDIRSDVVSVAAIKMGILATDKISWALRSTFNDVPGSAAGGAAAATSATATATSVATGASTAGEISGSPPEAIGTPSGIPFSIALVPVGSKSSPIGSPTSLILIVSVGL